MNRKKFFKSLLGLVFVPGVLCSLDKKSKIKTLRKDNYVFCGTLQGSFYYDISSGKYYFKRHEESKYKNRWTEIDRSMLGI